MQPIWKLYGNGSVGSQALLGIPHLMALRNDAVLSPVSRVWPFETGLGALPSRAKRDYLIVHAEIYPSVLPIQPVAGEVKDAVQVRTMARYFAELDDAGKLATLFGGPAYLTPEERDKIARDGVVGLASLIEQVLDVIWVFEVPVPIVAAGVGGNQLLVMVNAEPVGEAFAHQPLGSIEAWHRITIGIKHDPETIVSAHGVGDCGVCRNRWQRLYLLFF
jgi:hypothetical protein